MDNMEQMEMIRAAVSETLAEDFTHIEILKVNVREDIDSDGDEVLRIEVIFKGKPKDIDARQLSGTVRSVRPKLWDMGERAFPLFSFISEKDAGLGKLETA